MALAGIATAVMLFPVLKKQNETFALGLVAARILESGTIFVGVAFLLSIVTLRQAGAGADALVTSHALAALYDRIFLLGQSFMPAICDLLLGFLLYKSRLVPRGLSLIGIVGGPVLLVGYLAVLFGVIGQHGSLAGLSALLVAVFEFSLGVWLIVKGFDPEAVAKLEAKDAASLQLRLKSKKRPPHWQALEVPFAGGLTRQDESVVDESDWRLMGQESWLARRPPRENLRAVRGPWRRRP